MIIRYARCSHTPHSLPWEHRVVTRVHGGEAVPQDCPIVWVTQVLILTPVVLRNTRNNFSCTASTPKNKNKSAVFESHLGLRGSPFARQVSRRYSKGTNAITKSNDIYKANIHHLEGAQFLGVPH